MNRRLVGFILICVLSFLWPQAQGIGADAAKGVKAFAGPQFLPPANDNFANATVISGLTGSVAGSNLSATLEAGEPAQAANWDSMGNVSVWWSWTAPFTGRVAFDTFGSNFDTMLAVYTGPDVASLTEIASNDQAQVTDQSQVVFDAVSGTTYMIDVNGYLNSQGVIALHWGPGNNDFVNATVITGLSGTATGFNTGANKEASEPNHGGQAGGASVWWSWTASADGPVSFDTFGSSFDTLLAVYTGASVASLTTIASNDDFSFPSNLQSRVAFAAVSGTTYMIAVDGWGGGTGAITLNWGPANDNFVNAVAISGGSGTTAGWNVGATKEASEPDHAGNIGGASVWWTWTAPSDGYVSFDTFGSDFDTLLAVYTGPDVASLTEIASNDEAPAGGDQSQLVFGAVSGTTYMIAVDGWFDSQGAIALNWGPANDNFANAIVVSGGSGTAAGWNVGATTEAGEPAQAANWWWSAGSHSVWWSWTAPSSGYVSFDTFGSNYDTMLAVYTGPNVASLAEIASNDDTGWIVQSQVVFLAVSGTTYMITVDGWNGWTGAITLNWAPVPPPNDNFANAISVAGTTGTVTGSNVGATLEAGEPGIFGGSSVWWSWTAPTTGTMTLDTSDSDFDTLLSVYTGTTVTALTTVAGNAFQSQVAFLAVTGTTYRIAVDGWFGDQGSIVLNYALDSSTHTLTYTAGPHGSLTGVASQVVIAGQDGTPVTAVPDATYFFKQWSDGSTDNPRQDTNVAANVDVTAIFAQKFLVQFVTDGTPGATLDGDTAQTVFEGDNSLPVTAQAPAGFRFSFWTLDAVVYSAFNPLIVNNVTQPMTFAAHFAPWPGYTGQVGVVNLTSGGLELLDPVTQTLHGPYFGADFGTGPATSPLDVVVTPDGKTALVSVFAFGLIRFVDLSVPASPVLDPTSVTLSFAPEDIALTPDGRYALVTDSGNDHIGVINVTSRTLTQDLITTETATAVAVASDGRTVLAVNAFGGSVTSFLFDPVSGTLAPTAIIDVRPFYPMNVEFSPDGKTAIVASYASTSSTLGGACPVILRVDAPGAVTLMGFVPLPPHVFQAQSVVFSRRTGDKAYYNAVSNTPTLTNEILVLDVNGPGLVSLSGTTITLAQFQAPAGYYGVDNLAIDPSGRYLYVSNMDSAGPASPNYVAVVDLATNTETATIPVVNQPGSFPLGVAFPAFDLCHVVFQTDGTPGASLTGATSQTVVAWTDCTPVTAVPPAEYVFLNWSGDIPTTTSNPLTVRPVAANVTVIANFLREAGTVVVDVTPDNAPWSFTDGDAAVHSGTGPTTVTAVPTGSITLTWQPLAGFTTPAAPAPQPLVSGGTVTFSGAYTRQTGTVAVDVSPPAAPWSFTDGDAAVHSGTGPTTVTLVPTGSIALTWLPLAGHTTPPTPTPQTLVSGGTVTFSGVYTLVAGTGAVRVTIEPPAAVAAGAQWRLVTATTTTLWLASGQTEAGLAPGSVTVEFNGVLAWTKPANQGLVVVAGQTTVTSGTYTASSTGGLQIAIGPAAAVAAGAQWRRTGTTPYFDSGVTEFGLTPGTYAVEFKPVVGWTVPANLTGLVVLTGQVTTGTATYTASATGGLQITIGPAPAVAAGAQWRRVGTIPYFNSGAAELGITSGTYAVEFKPITGWTVPANLTGLVVLTGQVTTGTATYTASATGGLQITIGPAPAVAAGAQWRRTGTTPYFDSGVAELGITPGTYVVEFKPITGWAVPANLTGLVVLAGQTTTGIGTYTKNLGGAPGDYKISYKGCTIAINASNRGLIVTGANAATIKIQKLKKVPAKHADAAGKTLYMLGSPGLDFLTATGTIKSLSGTGAFIPAVTADVTGSIKMGVADASFAAPATSILSATSGTLPAGPALKISLSGVTLDNLVTSEAAAIKIGAKKTKTGTVPANVTAGAEILVGLSLSVGLTGGDMLADLVESTGGIKSLSVKGGALGQALTTATLATFLTPAAVAAVQHPSTVVVSGLHAGPSGAADGIGKVSAGTIHGVFVAGADEVGGLIQPSCDAAVKSWKATSASGDAFVSDKAKTQPSGIVEHLTAP